jgi:hypothetical protein
VCKKSEKLKPFENVPQVVAGALSLTTKPFRPTGTEQPAQTEADPETHCHDDDIYYDDDDDDHNNNNNNNGNPKQSFQHVRQSAMPAGLIGKTIVAPNDDVTNGFVKDGKMLPYVFEASETGEPNLRLLNFQLQRQRCNRR